MSLCLGAAQTDGLQLGAMESGEELFFPWWLVRKLDQPREVEQPHPSPSHMYHRPGSEREAVSQPLLVDQQSARPLGFSTFAAEVCWTNTETLTVTRVVGNAGEERRCPCRAGVGGK